MGLQGSGFTNDCKILTIFPLEAFCLTANPSTANSNDGHITLLITGGTPPYNIQWEYGGTGPDLNGINGGDYRAIITDYYGDFIIYKTCTLIQPTTTLRTRRISDNQITPQIGDRDLSVSEAFCLRRYGSRGSESFVFTGDSIVNQTRSWVSSGGKIIIFDETKKRWVLNNYAVPENERPGIIYSNSDKYANPPVNWIIEGTSYLPQISTTLGGVCPESVENFTITSRDVIGTERNGSIIFNSFLQSPLNEYTIDEGKTFQKSPLFTNLPKGTYMVGMKKTSNPGVNLEYRRIVINGENELEKRLYSKKANLLINEFLDGSLYSIPQKSEKTISLPLIEFLSDVSTNEEIEFKLIIKEERKKTIDEDNILFSTTVSFSKNDIEISPEITTTISGDSETINYSFSSLTLSENEIIKGNISSTIKISGSTISGGSITQGLSDITYDIKELKISPQRGNKVLFNGDRFILNNTLEYRKPEIRTIFQSRWLTSEESNEGFPFQGNINNPKSPGVSAKIKFNVNSDCLSMTDECFHKTNEISGGPYTGSSMNQKTVNGFNRGDVINIMVDLGKIPDNAGSCEKIKGTLKLIKNSGTPEELLYFEGTGGTCKKLYRYIVPFDANELFFIWEQKK